MKLEESSTVELKQEVKADLRRDIIAFANTTGGEIYVGFDKNGVAVGVNGAERVMEQISNMIRDGIKPDLSAYASIEAIKDSGKTIIRITVLRGTKRPYHLSEKGLKSTGVFIRNGVSSVPATDEMIREMLRESDGLAFDKSRCLNQELTFTYASKYFADNNLGFDENNKRTLKLIDSDGYYTNAAFLLSDQCEHSIKCAVFEGTGKTEFKMRKEFFGSVLKQMDEAFDFIELNNNLNSTFEGLKRIDNPDYPSYAIREALLNTIVHRDYDYSGSTLINIFADRIEFVSIGGLVKGMTIMDILGGVSQSRNTVLANVFYRLGLIESYGTGIHRILENYEDCSKQPTFTPAPASFVVVLPNKNTIGMFDTDDTICQKEKVLMMLEKKGEITRRDVEALFACSKFPALKIINELLAENKIIRIGSARAIKYKLC